MVARWVSARRKRPVPFRALAEQDGVHEATVRRACDAQGVTRRRTGPPRRNITVQQVVDLHHGGLSQRQIADELRCSGQLVQSRLTEAGLAPPADRRPRKGARTP